MCSVAYSRLVTMYRAPIIAASFATTLGCLWQFCETYLHYQHTYSQQLKHAINVLDSDLCREHHDGASIGGSKGHATYVDCEGAQEVKDGLRPSYRARKRFGGLVLMRSASMRVRGERVGKLLGQRRIARLFFLYNISANLVELFVS